MIRYAHFDAKRNLDAMMRLSVQWQTATQLEWMEFHSIQFDLNFNSFDPIAIYLKKKKKTVEPSIRYIFQHRNHRQVKVVRKSIPRKYRPNVLKK